MDNLHLPQALEQSERVLVAGAGGGFDVYAGIPIFERLRRLGKQATLANLSFTYLARTDADRMTPALYRIRPETTGNDGYFPERTLARFFARRGEDVTIYALDKVGVKPVLEAYRHLAQELELDAIVLVDGGTDILLRGDEQNLATPEEDMTSLAAVAALQVPTRIVTCIGFGVDTYHGVCHASWLENAAALTAEGAFLGATALLEKMPEVALYLDAVDDAEVRPREPIPY
jgi:hypothetical protein